MKRLVLSLLVTASLVGAPAPGQTRASLGLGGGTVRSEGGTSFSVASLSSTLRYTIPHFAFDAAGSIASLPAGLWSGQGRLELRGSTQPLVSGLRIGAEATLAGTKRSDGAWTGAAHQLSEILGVAPWGGVGLGAGPSGGWIANQPSVVALHTRGRLWWYPGGAPGRTIAQVSLEPTRFYGAWFTDASVSVTLERGPAVLSLWSAARLSSVYGSTGAGGAFLQVFVAPTVSLELGGGSYLRDPYQGFPRSGFFSAAVRVHASARPTRTAGRRWSPLVPEPRGDSLIVRFRFSNAHSVAIAGDWNAWSTVPLRPIGNGLWEGTLALNRGLYHFNLLVDGSDWVVPRGVTTVPDGLGGMVAVLLVR